MKFQTQHSAGKYKQQRLHDVIQVTGSMYPAGTGQYFREKWVNYIGIWKPPPGDDSTGDLTKNGQILKCEG